MSSITGIGPIPAELDRLDPDGFLNQIRKYLIALDAGRIALPGTTSTSTGTPAPTPGPPGPPGSPAPPSAPDLTAPPTPSGVSVTAGLDYIFITTDAPTFTEGHGYNRTLVYFTTYAPLIGWPLPTFSDAVLGHEFVGQVGSFAAPPGVQYHVWLKWRTNDGVLSASPQGGANGNQATTSKIGNANLGPLIIEAGNLATGAVTTAKFAAGIEPVAIVGTLPNPVGYTGPKTVFLTTDGKLYRYVAGAWVSSIAAVDISGQIVGTQITDGSISTPKLAANSVTAAKIAADTITANEIAANAITANELAANSVVAGKIAAAAVSATEISANAIQAVHLAANSIAVGTAAIQNGAIVDAMIANATISSAKIVSLSASKIVAGSIAVGEYVQSSDFVTGVSGWRFGGNTAELGSTSIRGLLTASQIDGRSLIIRDAAGTPILGVGTPLGAAYFGATVGGGNLLSNSSFELAGAGGVAQDWQAYSAGATGAVTYSQVTGVDGGLAQNIASAALGTTSSDRAGIRVTTAPRLVYVTGSSVSMSARVKGNAGAKVRLQTDFVLDDNVTFAGSVVSPAVTLTGDWQRITYSGAVPTNGARAYFYIWQEQNTSLSGAFLTVDRAQLESGDVATDWKPGNLDKVGLDNPISAANASTYIQAAAIGWAQIGNLNINVDGAIRSGQTAYDTGTGYYLGLTGGVPKLSIGSASRALLWDGSSLTVRGDIIATGNIQAGGATQIPTPIELSTLSVTGVDFVSPSSGNYSLPFFWTPIGTISFTAEATTDNAVLHMSANATFSGTGNPLYCSLLVVVDRDNNGTRATGDEFMEVFNVIPNSGGGPGTLILPIAKSKRFSVVQGVSYVWPLYARRTYDPVTLDDIEVRLEILKR